MNETDEERLHGIYAEAVRNRDFDKMLKINQSLYEKKFEKYQRLCIRLRESERRKNPDELDTPEVLNIKFEMKSIGRELDDLGNIASGIVWEERK